MGRTFALEAPPRALSFTTQLAALVGATVFQAAMGVASLGMIFFWSFGWNSELVTHFEFGGVRKEVAGEVTAIRDTSSRENKQRIKGNRFVYVVDGQRYEGESFSSSSALAIGQKVTVEYLVARPGRARIRGLRARRFSEAAGVLWVVPPVALVLAALGLVKGLRLRGLLRSGHIGHARIISKVPIGSNPARSPAVRCTFELVVPERSPGTYRDAWPDAHLESWRSWAQTHFLEHTSSTADALGDEDQEPVLYDPQHPGRAALLDDLDGGVRIHQDGRIEAPEWLAYQATSAAALVVNVLGVALQ